MLDSVFSPFYWSCECEENYIHANRELQCLKCGSPQFDSPSAIVDEVLKFGFELLPFGKKNLYVNPS